ncbi:MAG: PfkB family carbohydrate kinase, partial [Candidatus Bipolaricaulota bacterium]|nr:PfkB family carbohydrate kinase [Candidatus Bipolaricaulota bacterium]
MKRPVVAVLGDLNLDIFFPVCEVPPPGGEVHGEASLSPGGSAALTARWLSALGCEVRLAAAVGDDALGDWLVGALVRDGVPTRWVQRVRGQATGLCLA